MTVQDTASEVIFTGDGIQTSFLFTFRTDDLNWLTLEFITGLDDIVLNGDQDANPGGSINYLAAPPIGQQIRLYRIVPRTQLLDYTRYDAFDSESHEDALDKLTMMFQDTERTVSDKTKAITVESPIVNDDLTMFYSEPNATISEIAAVIRGTGSITWTIRHSTDRDGIGSEVITGGHVSSSVNGEIISIFDDPNILAMSYVWLEVTSVTGQVDELHLTIDYSEGI